MRQVCGITTGDILRRNAHNYPDKPALVDMGDGSRLTFAQWNSRVNRCANMLMDLGIRKGDKISTWCFNQHQYLEARFAAGKIGAAIVPVNFRLAPPEMRYIVNDSDAKLLIFDQSFTEKVDSVRSALNNVISYVVVERDTPLDWARGYEESLALYGDDEPTAHVAIEDVEAILYTSGTTGFPKGVVRPHYSTIWSALAHFFFVTEGVARDSVWLSAMPLFHMGVYETSFLPTVMIGGTNVVVRAFDPEQFLTIVAQEKVTGFFLVPTALSAVVSTQEQKQFDAGSLRYAYSAAAPLPMALRERAERVFSNMKLYEFYGSTEGGLSNYRSPADKTDFHDMPCIGRESICCDVRLLRVDGTDLEPSGDAEGEVGEIAVKGPIILTGYYKNPKTTRDAFTQDGYFLTGDLARIDSQGHLYIVGRSKEMLISGGENVYPAEIENVLFGHPSVADATVIGIPHPKWGETPCALIVLKPGAGVSEEEVIKFCKSNLAGYKCPATVKFLDAIPRSSAGKVQKHLLREIYGKESLATPKPAE